MSDELISRQAAKEAVKYIPWCDWKAVGDCLDELPAVEVVRCKDCEYYEGEECVNPYIWMSDGAHMWPEPDFFCKRGERREDLGCQD